MITLEDFKKLEIKIGKIVSIEKVPDADKLLKFIIDIGNEKRQIMAGMAEFIDNSNNLIGKEIPILINIEPKKFRGYDSHGMIIAADVKGRPIFLHPEKEIPPGSIVR